jgi:HSP20 family protein
MKGETIMAQRTRGKDGNGAKEQGQTTGSSNVPARIAERSRPLAHGGEAFHPLRRLREEIDTLFDRFFGDWPAPREAGFGLERFWDVNVEDTDKEIRVRAEAPGFEPKDFDINVSGNVLTIRAEHKQELEQNEGETRSWERRYGRFQRMITLPGAVDAEKVDANYRNGVLDLRLPRTEQAQRRRIEVKA